MRIKVYPYNRLMSKLFFPEHKKNGDLANYKIYCGASEKDIGTADSPIKIKSKQIYVENGNCYISMCQASGPSILGVYQVSFCKLRKGYFKVKNDRYSYYEDKKEIFTVDKKDGFLAVAFPSFNKIIDILRHMFAYGGYFAWEAEQKGGYKSFIKSFIKLNENRYRELYDSITEYKKYIKDITIALSQEVKLEIKTRSEMSDFIKSQAPVTDGNPVQLEFDFFN